MTNVSPIERLKEALSDTSDVYVNDGVDEERYFEGLRASIRRHMCEPFQVSAEVMEPGFDDVALGDSITGLCVAHNDGEWLVYQPEQDTFYCFWGPDAEQLGARGVIGSPLYCWSA